MVFTVSTPDFEMECIRFGSGKRQLIILPGISVSPIAGSAPFIEAAFSVFKTTHTVTVFDRKRNIKPGYSVSDMTDDTVAAMRSLGIGKADVYGASQGGMMALVMAMRYPELVERLAVASSAARASEASGKLIARWSELARAGDSSELHKSFFKNVYSAEYNKKYGRAIASLADRASPEELYRFAVLCDACLDFDCLEGLSSISCPTLVTGSDCDAVLSGDASREIASGIGCESFIYGGYSHAVYDEAPDHTDRLHRFFTKQC